MYTSKHLLPLLIAATCASPVDAADNASSHDGLAFDTGVLSTRNVDPSIANLFRHAPRFMPGESTVELKVNGDTRGRVKVRFDDAGVLCADRHFQRQAGLVSPPNYDDGVACFDLRRAWPQAAIQLDPAESKVILLVPTEALRASGHMSHNWQHGGVAGMLNYDALYLNSSGAGNLKFGQLGTEAGVNADDWIVRSRQTFSRFNGEDKISHQAAYAQRSFVGMKKVLQVGQVSLFNSLFGTGQVLGFQMFPESALMSGQGGAGLVDGVAETQSVVEVRQSGVLVYSTAVPAGPFRLQGFSLLNTRTDLEVTLTGSDGNTRQFIVPAATLLARAPMISPGLSFGAGRLEQQGGNSPLVGTIASGWQLTPDSSLNAGLLGATSYSAGAVNLETQLFNLTRLSLQSFLAQDSERGDTGTSLSAQLSHSLSERLNVTVNGSQKTSGYRELNDVLPQVNIVSEHRTHYQWGSGIGWATDSGNLNLSWARNTSFAGDNTNYLRGSWSRQFGRTYLGISLEHNTNALDGQADDRLYVTFNMPFGEGRDISSYLNTSKHSARSGVRYSDRISQNLNWSIGTDRDLRNNQTSFTSNVSFVTPVSQLNAGLSHTGDNTSWSAGARGAAVFHENGVTLSPYNVTDTFGIARVGNENGVRVDTPAGPVWTDSRGYAVLPTLSGYQRSGIQLDARSLAKNVDIDNAWRETEMARGGVGWVDFNVIRARRVLVETMVNGKHLPHGASVFDDSDNLVTVVGDDGTLFVSNASPGMVLEVQSSGKTVCKMKLDLSETADTSSALYETVTAICQ